MRARGLRRVPAAEYVRDTYGLRCSPAYLEKLGSTGGGPLYYRLGHQVIYEIPDLDVWALSRISGPLSKASDVPEAHADRAPAHPEVPAV